jgi:cytochrome c biogenesis protein CcmG/thiol:disulfide interchange protein DsbE
MATSTAQLPERGTGRLLRIGGSLLVAFVIIFSAWWIAGRQGIDDLGNAGMNASLLPAIGEQAPDFTVHDLTGRERSLSEFAGQPVWINFWGSWCPPCRAEMPDIQTAYQQMQPQGLVILAVSVRESATDAARFAHVNGATFMILSDPDQSATWTDYPVNNFPTHIFVNRDGTIASIALKPLSVADAVEHGEAIINSPAA